MSNVRKLAQQLAKQGRYGDSMLLHVQPREISAIEVILGRKTTTNPTTGLPEAFSWGKLLSGLGIGLAGILTGGAAVAPLMAIGGSLAASSFGDKKKDIDAQGKKALAQTNIPLIKIGMNPQEKPANYTPGVSPEHIQSIRQPLGNVSNAGTTYWNNPGFKAGGRIPRYDDGGMIPEQAQGQQIMADAVAALQGQSQDPDGAINRFIQVFGEDKLQELAAQLQCGGEQGMARGGLLKGPGGGLDDMMRARVGSREIALGGGEHVTPADVVSMLGDGSSEAGSRKLTAMEERVRKAKTGTPRQAGKINDRRVMPA